MISSVNFFNLRGQTVESYNEVKLIRLTSPINQNYQLMISTPESYSVPNSSQRYPVLYILDTEWNFGFIYDIYRSLKDQGLVPEMILVGIGYGSSVPDGNKRDRDLGPSLKKGGLNYAEIFSKFISNQLIPMIDSTYRTNASRIIHGHSMGGLFLSYMLFTNPELFDGYIISSPSWWWGKKQYIFKTEAEYFKRSNKLKANVFLSVGNLDGPPMTKPWLKFVSVMNTRHYREFKFTSSFIKGRDHLTVMDIAAEEGLKTICKYLNKAK